MTDQATKTADIIFDGTKAIEYSISDMFEIVHAMRALGLPAAEHLALLMRDCTQHSMDIRKAFAMYVGAQANGTLYRELEEERAK